MAAFFASYEETPLFEEKEGEDDSPMTAEEAQNITDKLKKKEEDVQKILNKLQEEKKDLNACTWFKGMSNVILYSQASDCQAYEDMKAKIKKSIAAHAHFEKCVNNKDLLQNHKERVDAAREIYREYWSLLSKTGEQMAIIESKVSRVLRSIKLCERIASKRKDKLPTCSAVRSCVKTLNEWLVEQDKLQKEWTKLGDAATKEQQEWQKIENETKAKYEKNKKMFKHILCGLAIVVGIAVVCTGIGAIAAAVTGPIAAILLSIAGTAEITAVMISGTGLAALLTTACVMGVKLRKSYFDHKCAVEGLKAMSNTVEAVESIKSTMTEVSTKSNKFDTMISKLDQFWTKMKATTTDSIKDIIDIMDEENEQPDDTDNGDNGVYLEEIMESLNEITNPITTLQTECKKCREVINIARDVIVKLQTGKKKSN